MKGRGRRTKNGLREKPSKKTQEENPRLSNRPVRATFRSPLTVKSQIWIAVSVYVLVAIVKKRLNLDASLYTLLQILSLTLFEKMPILQALSQAQPTSDNRAMDNQLKLFAS